MCKLRREICVLILLPLKLYSVFLLAYCCFSAIVLFIWNMLHVSSIYIYILVVIWSSPLDMAQWVTFVAIIDLNAWWLCPQVHSWGVCPHSFVSPYDHVLSTHVYLVWVERTKGKGQKTIESVKGGGWKIIQVRENSAQVLGVQIHQKDQILTTLRHKGTFEFLVPLTIILWWQFPGKQWYISASYRPGHSGRCVLAYVIPGQGFYKRILTRSFFHITKQFFFIQLA